MEINDFENRYLSGLNLFGDDFNIDQIKKWFEQEKEGYAELGSKNKSKYNYSYHALNKLHGYDYLSKYENLKVLSIGGAYGEELMPILDKITSIHILEPSQQLRTSHVGNIKIQYIEPSITGEIPLGDSSFDLITCYGVLHHVPNVSFVMSEMTRVLKLGGTILLREPIVSMGDWRKKRKGLTANERGIPLNVFHSINYKLNLHVTSERLCFTKPFDSIFFKFLRNSPYRFKLYVMFDKFLANFFYFNYKYHQTSFFSKFRPTCVFFVLKKQ